MMNSKAYLEQMSALIDELNRFADAEPYDHDAYNEVLFSIEDLNRNWFRSLHRRAFFGKLFFWFCVGLLAVVFYYITCYVLKGGPSP